MLPKPWNLNPWESVVVPTFECSNLSGLFRRASGRVKSSTMSLMRCLACLLSALLLLGACGTQMPPEEGGIFPYRWENHDLPNGLRAVLVDSGYPNLVGLYVVVQAGSRNEVEPGKTGFAHLFEHMMFRGTEKYPPERWEAIMQAAGASTNAYTSDDRTVYHAVFAAEDLEQILELEADRFQNLEYSETAFRTEAGAILGEYQQGAYSAFSILDRKVRETAWTQHTYRHQTIGFEADVRAMPEGFAYSREFFRRFYRPENVIVVIAGDFDHREAEAMLRRYYAAWEPGYEAPAIPVEPRQTAPRYETVEYSARTLPMLSFNWKAPAWSPTDRLAVATELLGSVAFGRNSEIFRKLVLREQRVQSLGAGFGLQRDPTVVTLSAMVSNPADLDAVREELKGAVARAKEDLVDARVLADTKSAMKYGFLMGLETAQNAAFSVIGPIINTGTLEAVDDYYRTLESLTPEDIREAARRILVDEGLTLVTLVQAER